MTKTGEQAEARQTAQVLRMSDYKPKSAPPTFPRFRKHQENTVWGAVTAAAMLAAPPKK
jgi:hypothetical protein